MAINGDQIKKHQAMEHRNSGREKVKKSMHKMREMSQHMEKNAREVEEYAQLIAQADKMGVKKRYDSF